MKIVRNLLRFYLTLHRDEKGNFLARMHVMTTNNSGPIDLDALATKFRQWRAQHKTPGTVIAAHREVLLERVAQSMTFEGEPITVTRLKILLNQTNQWTKKQES
ncbi:MAG: hypothetical protein HUU08_16705 [Candidatus Brocadia sp.]|nr:hypothetical protein [Candidatus Brocadia sp.]UJS16295.1 MAG: hypothetical protein L3J17_10245 [Candidatus Jettenia sp.]